MIFSQLTFSGLSSVFHNSTDIVWIWTYCEFTMSVTENFLCWGLNIYSWRAQLFWPSCNYSFVRNHGEQNCYLWKMFFKDNTVDVLDVNKHNLSTNWYFFQDSMNCFELFMSEQLLLDSMFHALISNCEHDGLMQTYVCKLCYHHWWTLLNLFEVHLTGGKWGHVTDDLKSTGKSTKACQYLLLKIKTINK